MLPKTQGRNKANGPRPSPALASPTNHRPATRRHSFIPHWSVAVLTLLILDPVLTWLAIDAGLGFEANPLLAPVIASLGLLGLLAVKIAVLAAVFVAWIRFPSGRAHGWVPWYASIVGVCIVVWNVANIGLTALFRTGLLAEVLA